MSKRSLDFMSLRERARHLQTCAGFGNLDTDYIEDHLRTVRNLAIEEAANTATYQFVAWSEGDMKNGPQLAKTIRELKTIALAAKGFKNG
jgi:hypothetical protein